jgi:hypothetical protein
LRNSSARNAAGARTGLRRRNTEGHRRPTGGAASRIYRWYGELKLLERDVEMRSGTLPIEKWLDQLDRIEHAAEQIRTPPSFGSEAYTLREHIALVRRTVLARADAAKT